MFLVQQQLGTWICCIDYHHLVLFCSHEKVIFIPEKNTQRWYVEAVAIYIFSLFHTKILGKSHPCPAWWNCLQGDVSCFKSSISWHSCQLLWSVISLFNKAYLRIFWFSECYVKFPIFFLYLLVFDSEFYPISLWHIIADFSFRPNSDKIQDQIHKYTKSLYQISHRIQNPRIS